jgi:hypothetical protein
LLLSNDIFTTPLATSPPVFRMKAVSVRST